ncbi:MAG: hypothetical protein WBA51_19115 [Erythrobacter sp.]
MLDAPPAVIIELPEEAPEEVAPHLPMEDAADGTLVIDLMPLAPKAQPQKCIESDPNPLENAILVCRDLTIDQRFGPEYGPTNEPDDFGSAVPRAKFRISDDATGEVNATNPSVGGWNAQGAEARIRIDF